jgi:hypothetical protein
MNQKRVRRINEDCKWHETGSAEMKYAKNVMNVDIRRIRGVVLLDGMALNIKNGLRMTVDMCIKSMR